jgi:flagellar basal-body rod protein FlgB
MNQALWVAKTGLDAQQTRMSVVSNNLANTNTTGFKRDRASFEDLLYQQVRQPGGSSSAQTQLPTGLQLGTGVRVVATSKNFDQGTQQQTGKALDMMVNGRGFFEVMMPDLHARRQLPDQRAGGAGHQQRLPGAAGHPGSRRHPIVDHRQRRHHQREDGRRGRIGGDRLADVD